MESLDTSPGALPSGGGVCLVFQLVCRFHKYWAYSSKSTVQPKMESCFQDGACFVSFFKGSAGPSALSLLPTTQHRLPQGSVLDSDMSVPHPFHTVSGRRQKGEGETSGAPLCSADAGLCCTQTEVPSAKTATLDGPRPEIP